MVKTIRKYRSVGTFALLLMIMLAAILPLTTTTVNLVEGRGSALPRQLSCFDRESHGQATTLNYSCRSSTTMTSRASIATTTSHTSSTIVTATPYTPSATVTAIPYTPSAPATVMPHTPSSTLPNAQRGVTTGWANVRTGPGTSYSTDHMDAPGTSVMIYATVSAQVVWGSISTWYRVSPLESNPLYIYGDLVRVFSEDNNGVNRGAPSSQGKIIVVSISQQELAAYDNGKLVVSAPVATGQPELPTPTGTYHIFAKYSPYTFISPWPVGSRYYYASVTANYAMEWARGGYFLHDAPWRGYFGPGANKWHWDPIMGENSGTHGCINIPTAPMSELYSWADIGTTIQINV